MIKAEEGEVIIKGKGMDLMAEFSLIACQLRKNIMEIGIPENVADKIIDAAVEVSKTL